MRWERSTGEAGKFKVGANTGPVVICGLSRREIARRLKRLRMYSQVPYVAYTRSRKRSRLSRRPPRLRRTSIVERIAEFTDNEGTSPQAVCSGSFPHHVRCSKQLMPSIVRLVSHYIRVIMLVYQILYRAVCERKGDLRLVIIAVRLG